MGYKYQKHWRREEKKMELELEKKFEETLRQEKLQSVYVNPYAEIEDDL